MKKLKALYRLLRIRSREKAKVRLERNQRQFERRLKAGIRFHGEPHHTTRSLSDTYMDSLK